MVGKSILFRKQDGVISPTDVVFSDKCGKRTEGFHHFMVIRNARFHIFSIAGNGDIKKGMEAPPAELFYMGEHGRRVLGAEYETVHHIGLQPVAVDFMGVIGVAGKGVAFTDSVHEPFAVVVGNIGSGACVYEHG